MSDIYYVKSPYFREAITTFAFRRKVNWLEEGMSLLSWKYKKVSSSSAVDLNKIYSYCQCWNGNKNTKIAGHRSISIGDIVVLEGNAKLITGGGWVAIPDTIWNKTIKE